MGVAIGRRKRKGELVGREVISADDRFLGVAGLRGGDCFGVAGEVGSEDFGVDFAGLVGGVSTNAGSLRGGGVAGGFEASWGGVAGGVSTAFEVGVGVFGSRSASTQRHVGE